jgi:hypothetical protein
MGDAGLCCFKAKLDDSVAPVASSEPPPRFLKRAKRLLLAARAATCWTLCAHRIVIDHPVRAPPCRLPYYQALVGV